MLGTRSQVDDYTDQKIGRLLVVKYLGNNKNRKAMWLCKCDCGADTVKIAAYLKDSKKSGVPRSCGKGKCRGRRKYTHGATSSSAGPMTKKAYTSWQRIKDRCFNINCADYTAYGAVGITMQKSWADNFDKFIEYVGNPPTVKHSIDRYPDQSGSYVEGNVRWATSAEQVQNSSKAKLVDNDVLNIRQAIKEGVSVADLAIEYGVVKATIRNVASRRTWKNI